MTRGAGAELTPMELIRELATGPSAINVDVIERLVALQERQDAKRGEAQFNEAMNLVQAQINPVSTDAQNDHTRSRYATLEAIDAAIRPVYLRHGFSLSFDNPKTSQDGITVSCRVMHIGGHSETRTLTGALDMAGSQGKSNKTAIQALGSTVSYLERYLTCMIFNVRIKREDNDGNRITGFITEQQAQSIEDMLAQVSWVPGKPQRQRFLSEIVGAKSVREINASDYKKACNFLEAKARESAK